MVPRVVLEELNLKDEFLNWLWVFWNQQSNMIRFKGTNDSISGALVVHGIKQQQGYTKYHHWILQIVLGGKGMGDHELETLERCQTDEYNEIDCCS